MKKKRCFNFPWCACGVEAAHEAKDSRSYNIVYTREGGGVGRLPAVELLQWAKLEGVEPGQYGVGCERHTEK